MDLRIIFLIAIVLLLPAASAAPARYDVVIVRSDLPYDWTVAQAYSQRAKIPIISTSPDRLDNNTREQLMGFLRAGHTSILVFGGEAAISPNIESEMVSSGFITHRIREVDRYGTSARVAIELYGTSRSVVIVGGDDTSGLLNSQMAALQTDSPILFIKADEIPGSVREALERLGVKEVILVPSKVSDPVKDELKSLYSVEEFPVFSGDRKLFDLRILDIALGLVLGVLLSLVLRWKRREKVPMNVLTSDEERVVRSIIDGGGEIGQDELYSLTGFSRPKISRLVAELVERDLIEKTQFKRTFKLKMKKELISD